MEPTRHCSPYIVVSAILALTSGCGGEIGSGPDAAHDHDTGVGIDGSTRADSGANDDASTPPGEDGGSDSGTTAAATLLFRTNFGPGVSLNAPHGFAGHSAWQDLLGTDLETGFTFPGPNAPNALLDAYFFGVQLIAPEPTNASTVGNHVVNEIRQVPGPDGNLAYSLFQNVITGSGWSAQSPFTIIRGWNHGEVTDLYISYWFRYPEDAVTQLYYPAGRARVLFEFKTGGYLNDWPGDYRIITQVMVAADGHPYWTTAGDNVANGPWDRTTYWIEENHSVPVPVGEWFFHEVYWHRSGGSDGRFWSAVNGEVIVDHAGPNMGDYNLPITRIMITNAYTGGNAPIEQHLTGLEVWDGFPCGVGVSCDSH